MKMVEWHQWLLDPGTSIGMEGRTEFRVYHA